MHPVTVTPGPVVAAPLRNRESCDQPTNSSWVKGPGFFGVSIYFHFYPSLEQFFSYEFTLKKELDSGQSWYIEGCFMARVF